jgi:Flp pilus assembly protein TadD
MAKGDARLAEAALQNALQKDPVSRTALATLLKLYSPEGRGRKGLQWISLLIQQYPQNAGLHFFEGVASFSVKELEKSEASVRQALTIDPKTPDACTCGDSVGQRSG